MPDKLLAAERGHGLAIFPRDIGVVNTVLEFFVLGFFDVGDIAKLNTGLTGNVVGGFDQLRQGF